MHSLQPSLPNSMEIFGFPLEGQWLVLGVGLALGSLSLFCFGAWTLRDSPQRPTDEAGNAPIERAPRRTQKWFPLGIACVIGSLFLLGMRFLFIQDELSSNEWIAAGGLAALLTAVVAEGTFLLLPLFTSKK